MPSPETVDKVLAAIRRGDAAAYFFDRLTSPDWIRPLAERGLFRSPAAPIPVEEGRYIQFPIWAPSRYLSRVAHLDPEAVLEVTRDIPDVDNPRVYEDLVDAAVAMPPELAAQLVPRVRAWIRAPYQLLLPLKAGALLSHLARGGQVEAALVLARSLLAVQQEERRLPEDGGIADLGFPPEATPIFDVWDYESILKEHIPDLVDAAGTDALILLRDVLAAAIRLSERVPEQGNEDYSWIWRPAIEDHEKNHDRTAKDFLVSALRDAALRLVERGQVPLRDLAAIFEAGQKYVFDRLFLHLLTRFPEAAPDLLRDRLLDGDLFDLAQVSHEFGLLLNSGFRHLQEEDKRALLAKIETGPDLTRFRERFVEEQGHEPSEDEVEQRQERWRHERLGLMGRDSLPEGWRGRFDELVGRFGAAPDEDFPFFFRELGWRCLTEDCPRTDRYANSGSHRCSS